MTLISPGNNSLEDTRDRFIAPILTVVMSVLLAIPSAHAEWHGATESLMGTRITVRLWHTNAEIGTDAVQEVLAEISRIERLMSTYMADSRISAINREAHIRPVDAGAELFRLIQRAVEVSEMTAGRFDITYDSVGQHYDFREGERPDPGTIESELDSIDYRYVVLNPAKETVEFLKEGVRINLGGIAKGYAVERSVALLRSLGIQYASVSAGGDSRLLGDRRGQPWLVGIQDPRDKTAIAIRLPLVDEAVSTSGDYERYFDEGGVRYHHIISPATGDSAREVQSVTIVGPDATMTDALSTSVFVMGVEEGLALIERMDGFDAVVIDANRDLHYSSGLSAGDD
ncbi:MAG: FAD:protein FMN transferase [Pseudomonadota bacterium]